MITIKYTNKNNPDDTLPNVYKSLEEKEAHEALNVFLLNDYDQEDITVEVLKAEEKETAKKELAESDHEVLKYLAKKARGKTNRKDDDDFEVLETEREKKRKKIKGE